MKQSKKNKNFNSNKVMPRFFGLALLFVALASLITFNAASLMFGKKHDYWMQVSEQFKKYNIPIPAKRGSIYSADGQILSTTIPEYRMYMDFMSWETDSVRRMNDQMERDRLLYLKIDSLSESMHKIFPEIDPQKFKDHMLEGRAQKSHHWLMYDPRISYVQLCEVKKLPLLSLKKCGFHTENFERRCNPFGPMAHATIGIYDEERDTLKTGLEAAYHSTLRGTPGVAHNEKVLNRYVPREDKPAVDGLDIVTTLDVGKQDLVEKVLGDKLRELDAEVGMCILMEVKTGDVKAISSLSRCKDGTYREIENRALSSHREPGSVFKPMAFMVAFEDGVIDLNSGYTVRNSARMMYGKMMRDATHLGKECWLSAVDCIKYSSNVGVSSLIDQAYHNNPTKFVDGLERIGIRTDLKLGLGYQKPTIRYPEKDKHGHWTNWWETAIPWMSIGYETQIPPIQTLMFYNGVANGGVMLKPRFVTCTKQGDKIIENFPIEYIHPNRPDKMMCSEATLKKVKTCLEAVVAKSDCTGKDAYTPTFPIAGKTGTAQIWTDTGRSRSYIVSFAGYFPANAPRYSMIVCIEKEGTAYGGKMCGPVFKKIAETIWAEEHREPLNKARDTSVTAKDAPVICNGNLQSTANVLRTLKVNYQSNYNSNGNITWGGNTSNDPTATTLTADATDSKTMPDLSGYGLRDAVFRMENMGLKVKSTGYGRVTEQSIAPGTAIKPGQVVNITLSTATKDKPRPKAQTTQPAAVSTTTNTATQQPEADNTEADNTKDTADKQKATADKQKATADKQKSEPAKDTPKPNKDTPKPKAEATKPKAEATKPKAEATKKTT